MASGLIRPAELEQGGDLVAVHVVGQPRHGLGLIFQPGGEFLQVHVDKEGGEPGDGFPVFCRFRLGEFRKALP